MEEPRIPVATTIGAGLIINDEDEACIMLMLGVTDEDAPTPDGFEANHTPLGAIALTQEAAAMIMAKMTQLLEEAKLAQEAVQSMGRDAGFEYIRNWEKRSIAPLN